MSPLWYPSKATVNEPAPPVKKLAGASGSLTEIVPNTKAAAAGPCSG